MTEGTGPLSLLSIGEILAQLVYRPRADPLRIALIGLCDIDDLLGDYFVYWIGTGFEMK